MTSNIMSFEELFSKYALTAGKDTLQAYLQHEMLPLTKLVSRKPCLGCQPTWLPNLFVHS